MIHLFQRRTCNEHNLISIFYKRQVTLNLACYFHFQIIEYFQKFILASGYESHDPATSIFKKRLLQRLPCTNVVIAKFPFSSNMRYISFNEVFIPFRQCWRVSLVHENNRPSQDICVGFRRNCQRTACEIQTPTFE